MAKDYVVIKGQANIIRNETAEGGNTAAEVGGAIYDVADKLEEVDGTLTSAIGTKLPISSVVDNLTSTHTDAPLSANQGKVLNDNKADKTTQVVAGNGLTGGGSLSGDVTVNVGNTDDSIVVGADGIKVDTQNSLTSTSTTKPLSAAQGKALQENKVDTSRTITAGNGLTGGGSLTEDRTIDINPADDSLTVTADNIKVNTNNTLTSTSTTQPLSANQGKVLNEKVVQVETDLNYMYPSVGIAKRVLADAGTIKSRSTLNDITNKFIDLLPNTKLLFCPHLSVKLRESGIYKYVTKLYDLGPGMLDGAQTTALNQPYLSGNIAPNEKYAIKNPNGGNTYMIHTPISFSATDKWSVSTSIEHYGSTRSGYYANGGISTLFGISGTSDTFIFKNESGSLVITSLGTLRGLKSKILTLVSNGNGVLDVYLDSKYITGIIVQTNVNLSKIYYSSIDSTFNGKLSYHCIRDIALSPTQVQDEYNYLRTIFPEIESVQIGTQTWATSNCEMTCTPRGNVIQETQAATNTEKITNADDREFNYDTGFWTKQAGWTIEGGKAVVTSGAAGSSLFRSSGLIVGKWYKFSFTIESISGNLELAITSNRRGYITPGTYTAFLKCDSTAYFGIICSGANTTAVIDNVSFQEIGWAGSTELYNGIYAQTGGTSEQKEYAAVKAAAMWRNVNNDPVLASVYGKKFNKYARKLLAMDIAYYNAANPTALWGWNIPTQAQLTTLASNGGNSLKVGGTNYWNTANGINSTGLTLLGGGYIDANGNYVGHKTHEGIWAKDADIARVALDADNSFNEVAATTEGYSIRLIKV